MRATLAVLLIVLCAGMCAGQPQPLDPVPFESPVYDAAQLLVEALDGALVAEPDVWHPRRATRYEFAIGALIALSLLTSGEISAEEAASKRLAEAWELLATEFLPEVVYAGVAYQPELGVGCPWPRLASDDDHPHNLALADLRAVPHDHWLYPAAQRVLWEATKAGVRDAPPWKGAVFWDSVPPDHWITQAALRLVEGLSPDAGDRLSLPDSGLRRDQIAMLAHDALRALVDIEHPTAEQQHLAVTWALLALELWPELQDLAVGEVFHAQWERPEDRNKQYPLVPKGEEITEDHWLHPIVTRVLEIAGANDREGA